MRILGYVLHEHCDCHLAELRATSWEPENYATLEEAIHVYIRHYSRRFEGHLYWAVHVNGKHLTMHLE